MGGKSQRCAEIWQATGPRRTPVWSRRVRRTATRTTATDRLCESRSIPTHSRIQRSRGRKDGRIINTSRMKALRETRSHFCVLVVLKAIQARPHLIWQSVGDNAFHLIPGSPLQLEIFLKTSPRNFRSRIVGNDCANQTFHSASSLPDNHDLGAVQQLFLLTKTKNKIKSILHNFPTV